MAQFMVVLDVVIVNVALPQMRDSLGLSVAGQQWVVNAYTLTFAGFLMLGGRAADLFGRRRVFMIGLGVFTICSLIGGLAQSGSGLIRRYRRVNQMSVAVSNYISPLRHWSLDQGVCAAASSVSGLTYDRSLRSQVPRG
jgi:MFS family permease